MANWLNQTFAYFLFHMAHGLKTIIHIWPAMIFLTVSPITLGPTIIFKQTKSNKNPDSCSIHPHCRKVVPNQPKQRHTCRHITKYKAVITCLVSHCLLPNTPQLYTAQKSAIKIAAENSSLFMMSDCVTIRLINV